jgi:hypothetical protein
LGLFMSRGEALVVRGGNEVSVVLKVIIGGVVTWFSLLAGHSWTKSWNGYGPPAEGCHFRYVEKYRFFQGVLLKRSNQVLCWHYAKELL